MNFVVPFEVPFVYTVLYKTCTLTLIFGKSFKLFEYLTFSIEIIEI